MTDLSPLLKNSSVLRNSLSLLDWSENCFNSVYNGLEEPEVR